jgi:predicted O-methyltransferase YrrM
MTKFMMSFFNDDTLIGVEIGVEYGLNAKTMLMMLPLEKLYLIDPYNGDDEMYHETKKYLRNYDDKITFIRKTSETAIDEIPDALDFVYIDGSHRYEAVKRDIELFYPKVKTGCVIGGHDFWANEIGVCKAVLEFARINNIQLQGKLTDWWIVKQ